MTQVVLCVAFLVAVPAKEPLLSGVTIRLTLHNYKVNYNYKPLPDLRLALEAVSIAMHFVCLARHK